MSEARHLTQAERCSLFLLDQKNGELVAKVFDGDIPGEKEEVGGQLSECTNTQSQGQLVLCIKAGLLFLLLLLLQGQKYRRQPREKEKFPRVAAPMMGWT